MKSDPPGPTVPAASPATRTGSDHLPGTLAVVSLAWLLMTAQEVLLFARPTPYGGPYVLHWDTYFFYAVLYNLIGPLLAATPALIVWMARFHQPVGARTALRLERLTLGLTALVVMLDHADNEVMRFMGLHLTLHLLRTYGAVEAWGADMLHIFSEDRGGPWLPFVVLGLSPLLLWVAGRRSPPVGAGLFEALRRWPRWRVGGLVTLLLLVPTVVYNLPGGRFRRTRVQPELLTLVRELGEASESGRVPEGFTDLARAYQARWLRENSDPAWQFGTDEHFPLLRMPRSPDSSHGAERYNVIYLQLETFRGWNVGFLHPDPRGSATPFLDSLASLPTSAWWSRFLSFGPPTVNGFITGHCSIQPHSRNAITTSFTLTVLRCLPSVLREHGWYTAYFTGSDPDWDNQRIWLARWYDEHVFYRDADERDRDVFRRAAERIRQIGAQQKPFFATVVSISNHYPFRSREATLDLTASRAPTEAIRNTMHYTDDVVREFVESLAHEPWFAHTLIVVVGDHGYNLGEHDGTAGQRSGWRETIWVPLLIAGLHPRLPQGRQDGTASLLDVPPTVADLLGIGDTVPWMGHSLLEAIPPSRMVVGGVGQVLFADRGRWSLVVDPNSGHLHLYDVREDPFQRADLGDSFPDTARALQREQKSEQVLVDYLLESNRVWRETGTKPRP